MEAAGIPAVKHKQKEQLALKRKSKAEESMQFVVKKFGYMTKGAGYPKCWNCSGDRVPGHSPTKVPTLLHLRAKGAKGVMTWVLKGSQALNDLFRSHEIAFAEVKEDDAP